MASTQLLPGGNDNHHHPAASNDTRHSASNEISSPSQDPMRCGAQSSAMHVTTGAVGVVPSGGPCLTTAYGTVVWPALPGLRSATELAATPARAPGDPPSGVTADHGDYHRGRECRQDPPGAMTPEESLKECGETVNAAGGSTLLRAACDACHRMKRKCDGKQPCTRCERRSRDCAYSNKQKSGPPKGSKRKLVEAEDDLPENRCVKPPRGGGGIALAASWLGRGDNEMTVVGARLAQCSSTDSAGSTPSPEARAAAAAAVAASCMNALAPVVPPALAAAGVLRPPPYNMLGPSSGLPGLSGGGSGGSIGSNVLPTVPLVTHPQYGTVYQHHQYPPEVYAVYLAELRQRSGSGSGIANSDGTAANEAPLTVEYDNSNMSGGLVSQPPRGCSDVDDSIFETTVSPAATTVAAATPSIGQVGDGSDISLPSSAAAPEHTTPAATAALAAAALAADVAAATETAGAGVTTPMTTTATTTVPTGSELLSEAVNFVEQLAGGGAGGEFLLADRGALPYPSRVSPSSQGGRVAAGSDGLCTSTIDVVDSAAASAALAAAVAAAIAEGYTTHHDNNGPEQEENGSSRVVLPSSRSGGGGGDDEGNKISFGGGDTCGTKDNLGHSPSAGEDVSPPPAKGNRFDAAPTMTGTKPRIAMPSTTTTENNAEDFACGSRATPRERQAAAGLLLYGATTYVGGGSGGGGSGRDREVSDVQHGRAAKEAGEYCQQRSPKAATDEILFQHPPKHAQDDVLAA